MGVILGVLYWDTHSVEPDFKTYVGHMFLDTICAHPALVPVDSSTAEDISAFFGPTDSVSNTTVARNSACEQCEVYA